ncbi:alpha/beta hydrolase [Spirosoma arcticum]
MNKRMLKSMLIWGGLVSLSTTACNRTDSAQPSALQPGPNRVTFQSEGAELVGNLFLPTNYQAGTRLPTVIVIGPWTQVKEQVGNRYAEQLAARGLAALSFDARFWGESGGEPRYYESTNEKTRDIQSAVTFLRTVGAVDSTRIGVLGVCAGAGAATRAVIADPRIRALATVAAWLQHPQTTLTIYEGAAGVQRRINLANAARQRYDQSRQTDYVAAYDTRPNSGAAMFFPVDYYGRAERGAIPQWTNQFAVMGWREWLEMNSIDGIAERITVPTLMVHSDSAALPANVRRFYNLIPATTPKNLIWTEGEHTRFYDTDPYVSRSATQVVEHFRQVFR